MPDGWTNQQLLAQLEMNRRKLEQQRATIRKRMKEDAEKLERIERQLSDIEQSRSYVEG